MNQWYDLLGAAFEKMMGLIGGGYYEIEDPTEVYRHTERMYLAPERADGRHALFDEHISPQVYTRGITDFSGKYLADYVVDRIEVTLITEDEKEYRQAHGTFYNFIVDHGIVFGG